VNPFTLIQPETLEEAIAALDTDDASVRPIAGGTALMLMMKSKLFVPEKLVSLHRLPATLREISIDESGQLHIGALVSLRSVELSPLVSRFDPVISDALRTLSNVRVRNVASVGGHLAHGDPHMDLPPILMALNARVVIQNKAGSRTLPLTEFLLGYYTTALQPGELITELIVPARDSEMSGAYLKYTALSADDWPMANVVSYLQMTEETITEARVAVSAAIEKPIRLYDVETFLKNQKPSTKVFADAAELAVSNLRPLADIRGSSGYKREIVRVYVRRSLERIATSPLFTGRGAGHE
jgi:aerobic carbon-monoxide dehydrogenase medium subunit